MGSLAIAIISLPLGLVVHHECRIIIGEVREQEHEDARLGIQTHQLTKYLLPALNSMVRSIMAFRRRITRPLGETWFVAGFSCPLGNMHRPIRS